ncbi:transmembrane protein 256 homolog [Tubulanus polymorphus]|uniref:transmembrane protein 256 homolog n=1 Tax=Tubulanus polymorphus TaxID=672921 RepID=UPI003DA4A8F8
MSGWFDLVTDGADLLNRIGQRTVDVFRGGSKLESGGLVEQPQVVLKELIPMAHSRVFVRMAGLSGAAAVIMGAYGAHGFRDDKASDLKMVYDTGSKYHIIHSAALLATPLCSRPHLTGTLMTVGLLLFSGSCYYHALTGNTAVRRVTPYGGMLLIAAWMSMILP